MNKRNQLRHYLLFTLIVGSFVFFAENALSATDCPGSIINPSIGGVCSMTYNQTTRKLTATSTVNSGARATGLYFVISSSGFNESKGLNFNTTYEATLPANVCGAVYCTLHYRYTAGDVCTIFSSAHEWPPISTECSDVCYREGTFTPGNSASCKFTVNKMCKRSDWLSSCTGSSGCIWGNRVTTNQSFPGDSRQINIVCPTLTVTKSGTGSGTVVSGEATPKINCGSTCSATFDYNASVVLTATSASGSVFAGWSGGGCSGTGTCSVTMTEARTVNAVFNTAPINYTLTVTKSGTGTGVVTSSPSGINCGGDCTEPYNSGTGVTLTATPDAGSTFTGWSGDCNSSGQVTMTVAKSCNAAFNHTQSAPTANAGLDKATKEGTTIQIGTATCGTDPNSDSMTYSWSCAGGTLSATNICQPNWTAPYINSDTNYTCTLTVTDEHGATGTDTMTATSQAYTLGVSLEAIPSSGTAPLNGVDLKATVTGDAAGTILYQFDCTNDGTYELEPAATNTNPYTAVDLCNYASTGSYTAKVRVQRGDASPTTGTATIIVSNLPSCTELLNNPDFLNDSNGWWTWNQSNTTETYSSGMLKITSTGNGTGCWSQTLIGLAGKTVSFKASLKKSAVAASNPYIAINISNNWGQTWQNNFGGISTISTVGEFEQTGTTVTIPADITSTRVNFCVSGAPAMESYADWVSLCDHTQSAPTANAGLDKATKEGSSVKLEGSGTDPDNDTFTCGWSCAGGTLSATNICQPNWTAPYINADTNYTCTLTVTDEHGATGTDTMTATSQAYTLSVALEAIPSSGTAPLNGVDLKATVTGDAIGTILYQFDCTNDGTYELEPAATNTNPYTAVDLCNYPSVGTYTAKVRVQRGDASPTTGTATITVSAIPIYKLTVTKSGTGTGIVTSGESPKKIDCGSTCSADYNENTSVTLTATAASGSFFTGWSGSDCSGIGTCIVTMSAAKTVDAGFHAQSAPTANAGLDKATKEGSSVKLEGSGSDPNGDTFSCSWSCAGGSLSATNICQPNWTAPYINADTNYTCTLTVTDEHGATGTDAMIATSQAYTLSVALEAIPSSGAAPLNGVDLKATVTGDAIGTILYQFDCTNDGTYELEPAATNTNPYTAVDLCNYPSVGSYTASVRVQRGDGSPAPDTASINVNIPPVVTYNLNVTRTGAGNGTITSSPAGISCGVDCDERYNEGTSITLTATPDATSVFTSWSANCVPVNGYPDRCVAVVNSDKSINALFDIRLFPPTASNLTAIQSDYCQVGPSAFLSWQFSDPDGGGQTAYQIQVDNNNSFSSPEKDSGIVSSSSNSYAVIPGSLSYNQTYYWRLMVWDDESQGSLWINGNSFTTPVHAYPSPNFIWTPVSLTKNQQASFTDQTSTYGGSVVIGWQWVFSGGTPPTASIANPKSKFSTLGIKVVQFTVTDSDGFSCATQKLVPVILHLPEWVEIAPTF
ncbi:MAG: PKD domain-containing protein [bacterium]